MAKYRKKAEVVEAIQFDARRADDFRSLKYAFEWGVWLRTEDGVAFLQTPNGYVALLHGDWIVRDAASNYARVKPEVFKTRYKKVEEPDA